MLRAPSTPGFDQIYTSVGREDSFLFLCLFLLFVWYSGLDEVGSLVFIIYVLRKVVPYLDPGLCVLIMSLGECMHRIRLFVYNEFCG